MTHDSMPWTRRDVLKTAGVAAAGLAGPYETPAAEDTNTRAKVIALFLAVFTYGRGIAGRQVPGQPLPDHGNQEYDRDFHGGNYATPHPEFYARTVLKDVRAPDHGTLDILEAVLPKAKARGV